MEGGWHFHDLYASTGKCFAWLDCYDDGRWIDFGVRGAGTAVRSTDRKLGVKGAAIEIYLYI
jgi:hypothetical protein